MSVNELLHAPAIREPRRTVAMRVLVVDDARSVRVLIQGFLTSIGHEVIEAEDGEQALAMFEAHQPNLIVMDVKMPNVDGIAATRNIRTAAGEDWVPIIMMSGLGSEHDMVRALDAGADDYIVKPVNLAILQAKMGSFQRLLKLHTQLRVFRSEQLEEQQLARALMEKIVHREGLDDPAVRWSVMPSAYFSGDVVAVQRGPNNELYALLGDATGHGLTASMSLIPALQVFYGMARKGLSVPQIAREMNSQLKALLPVGRYLAAVIVSVDETQRRATVWNGGMPGGVLIGPDQRVQPVLASAHLALGIVADAQFENTCETLSWQSRSELVLYSDGLVEAEDAQGAMYGEARLHRVLELAPQNARVEECFSDLRDHVAQLHAHDDASMLSIALK